MRVQGEGHPFAQLAFVAYDYAVTKYLDGFLIDRDLPHRDDVWITTLTGPEDWPDLELELNMVRPETIVSLGDAVTRLLLGEQEVEGLYGHPHPVGDLVVFPVHTPVPKEDVDRHTLYGCDMLRLSLYLRGELFPPLPYVPPPKPVPPKPQQAKFDL
jgi:hypothetical protein